MQLPSVYHEESVRSYVYSIDWRGRRLTDLLGLSHRLANVGVESEERSVKTVSGSTLRVSVVGVKRDAHEAMWCRCG